MARGVVRRIVFALLLASAGAAAQASVRVVEPADGSVLTGGSTAIIRWTGTVDADRIEEWEAFLSVDGGRYYSARITPHLDISIHEFRWTVPNVASTDVRILLRFGNEKDEHAIEVPLAFSIDPAAASIARSERASSPGEPARPGDPGVMQWTEGDRSGAHAAEFAASIPGLATAVPQQIDENSPIVSAGSALQRRPARTGTVSSAHLQVRRASLLLTGDVLRRSRRLNI